MRSTSHANQSWIRAASWLTQNICKAPSSLTPRLTLIYFKFKDDNTALLRSCALALLRLALLRLARFIVVFEFKNKLKLVWASISMAPCKYLVKFLLSCARRLRVAHCANFGALTPVLGGAHLCLCDLVN